MLYFWVNLHMILDTRHPPSSYPNTTQHVWYPKDVVTHLGCFHWSVLIGLLMCFSIRGQDLTEPRAVNRATPENRTPLSSLAGRTRHGCGSKLRAVLKNPWDLNPGPVGGLKVWRLPLRLPPPQWLDVAMNFLMIFANYFRYLAMRLVHCLI